MSTCTAAHFAVPAPSTGRARHSHRVRRSLACWASASQETAASPQTAARSQCWAQAVVELPPYKRGCHLITAKVCAALPELREFEVGLANVFINHTSASLTINENADPDVRLDLSDALDRLCPENQPFRHTDEGPDDMPAHVKSSLMGPSLTVPVRHGRLALGTWQGIYLNEHRNYGGARTVVVTVQGMKRADGRTYPSSTYR